MVDKIIAVRNTLLDVCTLLGCIYGSLSETYLMT